MYSIPTLIILTPPTLYHRRVFLSRVKTLSLRMIPSSRLTSPPLSYPSGRLPSVSTYPLSLTFSAVALVGMVVRSLSRSTLNIALSPIPPICDRLPLWLHRLLGALWTGTKRSLEYRNRLVYAILRSCIHTVNLIFLSLYRSRLFLTFLQPLLNWTSPNSHIPLIWVTAVSWLSRWVNGVSLRCPPRCPCSRSLTEKRRVGIESELLAVVRVWVPLIMHWVYTRLGHQHHYSMVVIAASHTTPSLRPTRQIPMILLRSLYTTIPRLLPYHLPHPLTATSLLITQSYQRPGGRPHHLLSVALADPLRPSWYSRYLEHTEVSIVYTSNMI